MRLAVAPESTIRTIAIEKAITRFFSTQSSTGSYHRLAVRITMPSSSLTLPVTNIAMAAGTKVTDKIMAPNNAMTTVKAIG